LLGIKTNHHRHLAKVNPMKKYALIAFAVAGSALLLTGSQAVEAAPTFPITLNFNYDWDCNGNDGTSSWSINSNRTFTSTTSSGTWDYRRGTLQVTYDSGTEYLGQRRAVPGFCFEGTMESYTGLTGCWDGCVQ
jgi:hypothetical protein